MNGTSKFLIPLVLYFQVPYLIRTLAEAECVDQGVFEGILRGIYATKYLLIFIISFCLFSAISFTVYQLVLSELGRFLATYFSFRKCSTESSKL